MMPGRLRTDVLDALVRLRLTLTATRDERVRAELRDVEALLRRQVGPAVPKRDAARLLGVSVTALDRWIDRGCLPAVASAPASKRLGVETSPLLDLATEVARLRRSGRRRGLLSEALRRLGRRERGRRIVYRREVAALPRPNETLEELQRAFAETTPEERVLELAALNRSLDLVLR